MAAVLTCIVYITSRAPVRVGTRLTHVERIAAGLEAALATGRRALGQTTTQALGDVGQRTSHVAIGLAAATGQPDTAMSGLATPSFARVGPVVFRRRWQRFRGRRRRTDLGQIQRRPSPKQQVIVARQRPLVRSNLRLSRLKHLKRLRGPTIDRNVHVNAKVLVVTHHHTTHGRW